MPLFASNIFLCCELHLLPLLRCTIIPHMCLYASPHILCISMSVHVPCPFVIKMSFLICLPMSCYFPGKSLKLPHNSHFQMSSCPLCCLPISLSPCLIMPCHVPTMSLCLPMSLSVHFHTPNLKTLSWSHSLLTSCC